MEVDADGDILKFERGIVGLRRERQVTILGASPKDTSLRELYRLKSCDDLALGHISLIEGEGDLVGCHDANGDVGLF